MKKMIYTTFFLMMILFAKSQLLSYTQGLPGFPGAMSNYGNEQVYVNNSMFYMVSGGALYKYNLHNLTGQNLWANYYYVNAIQPDTGQGFVLLKNNNTILKGNATTQSLTDITPQVTGAYISNIRTRNGKTWALINYHVLGIYNGQQWQYDTSEYGLAGKLIIKNDSAVYLIDSSGLNLVLFNGDTFNNNFARMPDNINSRAWDIDAHGNIWVADSTQLFYVDSAGNTTIKSTLNSYYDGYFLNVVADDSGNVFATNNGNIYQYSGPSMYQYYYGYTSYNQNYLYAGCDRAKGLLYFFFGDSLYSFNRQILNSYPVAYPDYAEITSFSPYNFATRQGIFYWNADNYFYLNLALNAPYFKDSTASPYANDVTCFIQSGQVNNYYNYGTQVYGYGTHHGVFGTYTPINNSMLPDTNITCMYFLNNYPDSAYVIGTDKGLCIFKNGNYTSFNTSNSPLPSNNITCLVANENSLYIGTANGLAKYTNGQWQVFDSATTGTPFGVTGIGFNYVYNSGLYTYQVWASTMGKGLFIFQTDSTPVHLNTANGGLSDDSLFLISTITGNECYPLPVLGTKHHGLAIWQNSTFTYDTVIYNSYYSNYIKCSQVSKATNAPGGMLFLSGSNLLYSNFCVGAVTTTPPPVDLLKWTTDGNWLNIYLPQNYTGKGTINLFNTIGQQIIVLESANVAPGTPVSLPVSNLSPGVYIIKAMFNSRTATAKAELVR